MSSPIGAPAHSNHPKPIRFSGIPEIRRNLLQAALYQQLSEDYQQAADNYDRGDRWGQLVRDAFIKNARSSDDKADAFSESAASDDEIIPYLKHCDQYNQTKLSLRISAPKMVLADWKNCPIQPGEEPPFDTPLGPSFMRGKPPEIDDQSLSGFFAPSNPLMNMADRGKRALLACRLVECLRGNFEILHPHITQAQTTELFSKMYESLGTTDIGDPTPKNH